MVVCLRSALCRLYLADMIRQEKAVIWPRYIDKECDTTSAIAGRGSNEVSS